MKKTSKIGAFLARLGLRTKCCYAKDYSPIGWEHRGYCTSCQKRVW